MQARVARCALMREVANVGTDRDWKVLGHGRLPERLLLARHVGHFKWRPTMR